MQKKYSDKQENSKENNRIAARQKAIQKEKAEKYWEKVRMHEDGCVAARQMEVEAVRIEKR